MLIERVKAWLRCRSSDSRDKMFNRGFDYALSKLVRGGKSVQELEDEVEYLGDGTDFDDGICVAITAFIQLANPNLAVGLPVITRVESEDNPR